MTGRTTYTSTRGDSPPAEFGDVLLGGLAPDGGLYVPDRWPVLPDLTSDASYTDVAKAVIAPFVAPTIGASELAAMVDDAYSTFDDPRVCPLRRVDERLWLLELFHGPTLAFKDVALQLVGRLFDHELARRGRRATILVATSGDTGSAAMAACAGRASLECVVLFPAGRTSEVQRRQMTTIEAPNVAAVAVDGTFDDCQDLVKAAFADRAFAAEVCLSAMNSINWARVMAQVVYYVTATKAVGEQVTFAVPTGNFGNVLAGWVAEQMGLRTEGLLVASNRNDILCRWLDEGVLLAEDVVPTLSPSMDIQISSNLERLLFELLDRDGESTAEHMREFRRTGSVEVPRPDQRWWGAALSDGETLAVVADEHERHGLLLDPHTAVGVGAARRRMTDLPDAPVVALATADPAKFPDAVEKATGVRPGLPERYADLYDRAERCTELPADLAEVRRLVRARLAR